MVAFFETGKKKKNIVMSSENHCEDSGKPLRRLLKPSQWFGEDIAMVFFRI
jgi:hypothetical protein